MYAKVFTSMFDGTLAEHWEAWVTFVAMLVLCDADGTVDMTLTAISRRTGLPLAIVAAGVAVLEAPDPESRSPEDDGRRIVRIDPHRSWGWRIVNHAHYRGIHDAEQRRAMTRERVRRHRAKSEQLDLVTHLVTPCNAGNDIQKQTQTQKQDVKASPSLNTITGEVVITIPTNRTSATGDEFGISGEQVAELASLYPAVDTLSTLKAIRGWAIANPRRRKTADGMMRHVHAWFGRSQDSAGRTAGARAASDASYAAVNDGGAQ